jgi:Alginate lyase
MMTNCGGRGAKRRVRACTALAAVVILQLAVLFLERVQEATAAGSSADAATDSTAALPRVFLLHADRLQANRERFRAGEPTIVADVQQLEQEAKRLLDAKPLSVVDKDYTPPSGDKHDYMSQAPYFWADPTQPDGSPYIRRDGERNPEINKYRNHQNMSRMAGNVETLALAYYFTGDEKYADKATEFLSAWFLEPATKMNPNLQFAQAIPGTNTGRGIGIIESICLARLVDDIGLLAGSKSWTDENQHGLEQWYGDYLKWMQESKNGHEESAAKNNHGTYYDMQVVSYAMFLGKMDVAKSVLDQLGTKRIALQVEPDGREPLELARTKAWSYSTGNLSGLMSLARLGEHLDIDLWHYQTSDGRSIQQAVDFLLPFATGEKPWSFQQMGGWSPGGFAGIVRQAAAKYPDDRYSTALAKLTAKESGPNWHDLTR